jgi:predicted phage-related endonuclease
MWGDFPVVFAQVEEEVAKIELALKEAKERQEELRNGLYEKMAEYDIKSYTGERIKLTRVLPTKSKTFDSTRFKEEHPDLYKEYQKETSKAGSLRITLV